MTEHVRTTRDSLVRWLSSDLGLKMTACALRTGTIVPVASTRLASARLLHQEEIHRLTAAQLFWVSDDLAARAVVDATESPNWSITPSDLPAAQGFLLCGSPIASYGEAGSTMEVVGVTWGHSLQDDPGRNLWITFWARYVGPLGPIPGAPSMLWDNEAVLPWGPVDAADLSSEPRADLRNLEKISATRTTLQWCRVVHAIWKLLRSDPHPRDR